MDGKITSLPPLTNVDRAADLLEVVDVSAGASTRATVNDLLGLSSDPVGRLEVQTVRNKIFDATNSFILSTGNAFFADAADNTKQLGFDLSNQPTGVRRTFRVPGGNGTLVDTASVQTLDSKTLTNATLVSPTINNPVISANAINEFTVGNGVTIAGVNFKTGKVSTPDAVDTGAVKDGAITPNKLVPASGSGWNWAVWNPTFTNFTLGNGGLVARYNQIGKTVFGRLSILLGTTSAMAAGEMSLTLPVPSVDYGNSQHNFNIIGNGWLDDNGVTNFPLFVTMSSTTSIRLCVARADTTYLSGYTPITNSVPISGGAGTGDHIHIQFAYEAA